MPDAQGLGGARGYSSPLYARALAHVGEPINLTGSGGWLLAREIPGSPDRDGTCCYPIFTCQRWRRLCDDIEALKGRLVTISLVTDPFCPLEHRTLADLFPDRCVPFKQHYVVLLREPASVHHSHLRNARRGLRENVVTVCDEPLREVSEWQALYATLRQRHRIRGPAAFSDESLAAQLSVPGLVMLKAQRRATGEVTGYCLFFIDGERVFYHLGAYSQEGYRSRASFAIFATAIEHFRGNHALRYLSLGGEAGLVSEVGGLDRFKRGWSTTQRTVYFCGVILDPPRFQELGRARSRADSDFFPPYRDSPYS